MVHIEKISLRGFKSFGNQRVGIPLSKGFTAIVGPNGSGKSNVVDAICFVLGRMSTKSMRAEKFSDLIWVGNERYPAGSYAEVSLHLNNADRKLPLDEAKVVISRRVDRSGRSVYRTNNKRVTRNEVIDLLSMAGIFAEGYNIVLQGDITKLVKMTPLERRMLIDELSGISEYDMKKERAVRELSKAEENIRATNLVIDEVLSQLRRLERERDEAVRYQDLISQIREIRWQFQHNQLRKFRERYNAILEKTDQGTARIEEIESQIQDISVEVERREERQDELGRTIEKRLDVDQERIGKQMEEVRAQIVRAQENMKNNRQNLDRQFQHAKRLEQEIEANAEKVKDNTNKMKVLEAQRTAISTSVEELREVQGRLQAEIEELEAEKSSLRGELDGVEASLADARGADGIARQASADARIKVNRAREELNYLKRSLEECETRGELLAERKANTEAELAGTKEELASLLESIRELETDVEKYSRTLSDVNRELDQKSSDEMRMEALTRAMRETENPTKKAVAYLLEKKESGEVPGLLGTVSDLAKVPDRFKVPVSAAASQFSDFLVVDDRGVAAHCVEMLKGEGIGWANFIPVKDLERLNDKPDAETLKGQGVVRLALDAVEYEERLEPLYDFVLGRTIITEDLASSSALPRKFRTVTLQGDVLDPSGIVSGGHFDPLGTGFTSMVDFDEKDLEAVKQEVQSLRAEKENLSSELERIRDDIVIKEKKRGELEAGTRDRARSIEIIDAEISENLAKSREVSKSFKECERQIKVLEGDAEQSRLAAKRAAEELRGQEQKRDNLLREMESPELNKLDKQFRQCASEINNKVASASRLGSDIAALEKEIQILNESSLRMGKEAQEARQSTSGLQVVLEKIEKDIPVLEKEHSQLITSRQEIGEEIKQLRTTINVEKRDLIDLVSRRNALVEDKNRLSVEINSSVYERSQLDVQIHNLEHELSLVDYEYEPVELDDLEELSKRVSALEVEKARLEPVNMRAIEAYEEQEERFNDYKERRDKVMEEREAILQFMAEIEAKKRQVFMEAFSNIASNFETIFAKLSPGGIGKLLLENEEDPFAGGLEIEAKPAGKEVAVIDSMSGGEKALTALAFIFAVQAYKPSPFYILDEIDAHLDDDNVKRVAELVADTSKGSQFVVVTLRDSMMAQADELIGVSMEENAISKVVGVRMEAGRLIEEGGGGGVAAEAGGAGA